MDARSSHIVARLLGVALLVLGLLIHARTGEARLDPFYIVHGQSYGKITPRVLFVVDTSGSMAFRQPWPDSLCAWSDCESENANQSRINAARRVINTVVEEAGESATFALMTFGMAEPPKSSSEVPDECYYWGNGNYYRFTWITHTNQPNGGVWSPLTNIFGGNGTWLLCGDNRPFPYLRHDNLGGFSLPDDQNFALTDTPLYKAKSNSTAFTNSANFARKVQFFPRFVGRRANLDCNDVRQKAIVTGSWGDYGNTNTNKVNNICGRDFYYWPYVDGYPGYSYHVGYSPYDMWHVECQDDNYCYSTSSAQHRIGHNRRNYDKGATLYVPFYSEAVIASPQVPIDAKGPLDSDDAAVMFDGLTSKAHLGGLDVTGGTPWRTAVGDVDTYVSIDAQGKPVAKLALPKSNAEFSHTTVASYLSFLTTIAEQDICRPTMAILLTDGQPDPWDSEGGSTLYSRLSKLRKKLGVKVYVVGFSQGGWSNTTAFDRMHHIACAAAGANNTTSPCGGTNNYNWDTCANPDDPDDGCAWLAGDDEELAKALGSIIDDIIETSVPAGPPTIANDFQLSDLNDPNSDQAAVQTTIDAWTETPAWFGHVTRGGCTDEDPDNPGQLAEYCANAATLPIETEETETYGPCPLGRVWDAGECLAQTVWTQRRIYTHDFNNELIQISTSTGASSGKFRTLVKALNAQGKINPPLTPGNENIEIDRMVKRLLGGDTPQGWKLPGLANSAPVLIRRVPQYDGGFLPSVGIRDPHCAGRRNVIGDNVPDTLEAFSTEAWELTSGGGLSDHYDYAEAVLIGDDFGVLHAFHYDSGNELFGFLPMALINNARVLAVNGTQNFGQPDDLSKHVFGIASTVNAGWAYDHEAKVWRHLAVFGLGPGGSEILTLDVSHMGRLQDNDPVEVMWTSSTSETATEFANTLGETWSRPALTYAVPNHEMSLEPTAYMVFGSGYREGVGHLQRGRVVWLVDAMTGETVTEKAYVPPPANGTTYDVLADIAEIGDVAMGSHCLSRYWGEMQEAYWADPAGRVFRWDLATAVGDPKSFPHAADGGGKWVKDGQGFAVAKESFRFPACQGTDEFSCSIAAIGGSSKGDVFTFGPAVAANNRIDDIDDPGDVLAEGDRDQFLIALTSGNPNDTAIDGGATNSNFHSSIYLMVDDHRADPKAGFDVPGFGPATMPGAHPHFMRLPLSAIERTRHVEYPNGTTEDQTRPFSKRARPIRAPMIRVTGVADGTEQVDAEVYYVTFTIYEPGDSVCDPRWFDKDKGEWIYDAGATYEVSFRLAISGNDPFNFQNGYVLPSDPGDGFGSSGALSMPQVRQLDSCSDGNCGASLVAPKTSPCDPNTDSPAVGGVVSVSTGYSELEGFTPLELDL
jgi:hypothetical protein